MTSLASADVKLGSSCRTALKKHHFLYVFRLMRRLSQLSTKLIIAGVSLCLTLPLGGATAPLRALTHSHRLSVLVSYRVVVRGVTRLRGQLNPEETTVLSPLRDPSAVVAPSVLDRESSASP